MGTECEIVAPEGDAGASFLSVFIIERLLDRLAVVVFLGEDLGSRDFASPPVVAVRFQLGESRLKAIDGFD